MWSAGHETSPVHVPPHVILPVAARGQFRGWHPTPQVRKLRQEWPRSWLRATASTDPRPRPFTRPVDGVDRANSQGASVDDAVVSPAPPRGTAAFSDGPPPPTLASSLVFEHTAFSDCVCVYSSSGHLIPTRTASPTRAGSHLSSLFVSKRGTFS